MKAFELSNSPRNSALRQRSPKDLVTIAIPHPAAILPTPQLIWAVRHFFALRQKRAVRWLPDDDFAYVDELELKGLLRASERLTGTTRLGELLHPIVDYVGDVTKFDTTVR